MGSKSTRPVLDPAHLDGLAIELLLHSDVRHRRSRVSVPDPGFAMSDLRTRGLRSALPAGSGTPVATRTQIPSAACARARRAFRRIPSDFPQMTLSDLPRPEPEAPQVCPADDVTGLSVRDDTRRTIYLWCRQDVGLDEVRASALSLSRGASAPALPCLLRLVAREHDDLASDDVASHDPLPSRTRRSVGIQRCGRRPTSFTDNPGRFSDAQRGRDAGDDTRAPARSVQPLRKDVEMLCDGVGHHLRPLDGMP
jgi:hypothetical protein